VSAAKGNKRFFAIMRGKNNTLENKTGDGSTKYSCQIVI
jgi:hypothetical protein